MKLVSFPRRAVAAAVLTLCVLSGGVQAAGPAAARTPGERRANDKPNIVFILADDAGLGDFGCYGGRTIATPNVDRLAREGLLCTNAYSGSAVCGPTRCVLMTGLHTGHCLRRANQSKDGLLSLAPNTMTVARLLKQAGYATGGFGKWGLGNEGTSGAAELQGFDAFYGYYDQVHAHDYFPAELVRDGRREPLVGNAGGGRKQYSHELIVGETLRFIEANRERPFFAYACWTLPHGEFDVPAVAPEFADKPWKPDQKNAATMLKLLDESVGRVMAKLAELGLEQNTIVIFSSDNGAQHPGETEWNSTAGLRGAKRSLYEGGIRAPFVVCWPGRIKPGSESHALMGHVDLLATSAELSGQSAPPSDGISLVGLWRGTAQADPDRFLYWEIYEGPAPFQQALRQGDWKTYRRGLQDPVELYNLVADPAEKSDVAAQYPDVASKLSTLANSQHTPSSHYDAVDHFTGKKGAKKGPAKPKKKKGDAGA